MKTISIYIIPQPLFLVKYFFQKFQAEKGDRLLFQAGTSYSITLSRPPTSFICVASTIATFGPVPISAAQAKTEQDCNK